jgi:hypothetical protein
MSRNGLLGSLGAVALPLLGATLIGAPSALADGGIGLPSVPASLALPVALPSAVVGTVSATVAAATSVTDAAVSVLPPVSTLPAAPPVVPTVTAAVAVVGSDNASAAVAPPTEPVTAVPRPLRHPQAPVRISHRRHVAVSDSPASPASQARRLPVTRDRRVPTPPIPDRTVAGWFGGSAGAAGAGFLLLLLAVAAAVLAVVRPRLGERLTSLLRIPHPAVLALELERPD